ncbi:MAG: hypothetical protein WC008_04985 [Bacilli bacterium]
MNKKIFIILLLTCLLFLSSCKKEEEIKVILPNGTPLIAIAGVENKFVNYENVGNTFLLTAAFTSKSHDIIIAPINVGAKLFNNKSSIYQLDSIITFSNIYLVSKGKLDSVDDLNGKKIAAYGSNLTPGIMLEKALDGIDYEVDYYSGMSEVVGFLVNDTVDVIMSAEPTLSNLIISKKLDLNILDISELLIDYIPMIPQAGIFVNPESKNQKEISDYITQIKENIGYLNTSPTFYSKIVSNKNEWLELLGEEIINESIPKSNIDFKKAKEYKEELKIFYDFLNSVNKEILSGDIDEEFYR